MGRTTITVKVQNLEDVMRAERGEISSQDIRTVELDALVDTGATLLCLPSKLVTELGLPPLGTRTSTTANGPKVTRVYGGALLTILDRSCTTDVMELANGIPALLGYVPLEVLDLQVDPKAQAVIANPEHGDKIVLDLF